MPAFLLRVGLASPRCSVRYAGATFLYIISIFLYRRKPPRGMYISDFQRKAPHCFPKQCGAFRKLGSVMSVNRWCNDITDQSNAEALRGDMSAPSGYPPAGVIFIEFSQSFTIYPRVSAPRKHVLGAKNCAFFQILPIHFRISPQGTEGVLIFLSPLGASTISLYLL